MPIAICGVHEVPQLANTPLDHIVSIHEAGFEPGCGFQPGPDITQFRHPFTLHSFTFRDVGQAHEAEAFTEVQMQRLTAVFAQTKPEDRVLFHCLAGRSRSAAAAFLFLVYHGATYEQAYDGIVAVRGDIARPNPLMIKLADRLWSHEGKMLEYVCQRKGDLEYLKPITTPITT